MLDEVALAKYIEQAVKLRLAGHELLLCRTIPELLRSANGIGPEAFPDKMRNKIDNAKPTVIIASVSCPSHKMISLRRSALQKSQHFM